MAEHLRSVSGFERVIDVREVPLGIKSFATYPIHETVLAQQQTETQKVLSSLHFFSREFKGSRSFDGIGTANDYMKERNQALVVCTDPAEVSFVPERRKRTIVRYDSQVDDYVPDGHLLTKWSEPFTGDEIRHCKGLVVLCDSTQKIGVQLHSSDTAVLYGRDTTDFANEELSSERLKHAILYQEARNSRNNLYLNEGIGRLLMKEFLAEQDKSQHYAA